MLPSELLADPAAWITGDLARDSDGRPVEPKNPRAICWCLAGAFRRCCPEDRQTANKQAHKLQLALQGQGFETAVFFNDTPGRTHAEVIALLKSAGL